MATTSTSQQSTEIEDAWERFRTAATRVAELQAALWSDELRLGAGLLTGRPTLADAYTAYYRFVSEEGARFAMAQAELGIDYARSVTELTREYEQRLAERFHAVAEDTARAEQAGAPQAKSGGTAAKSRSRSTKK
ncbi:hypothetical protein ACH4E8_08730 [Streptomyces sp. NPDC017979]|uniref:hypothetical protein n=1 Tax=Streptomyces sp. NPDC017979 TaxID=3365024 RepID=UPI00379E82A7